VIRTVGNCKYGVQIPRAVCSFRSFGDVLFVSGEIKNEREKNIADHYKGLATIHVFIQNKDK
jgi:hypothetical protein